MEKHRIVFVNLKVGGFFDIKCVDSVYRLFKQMEEKGEVQIFFDERKNCQQKNISE